MVEFQAVSKVYVPRGGGSVIRALTEASFRVARGEALLIAGPTGAGKSTVLRLIAGEEAPSQGRLLVDGDEVGTLGRRGIARLRRRLGVVPQEPRLAADRTVLDNLVLVLQAIGFRPGPARARAREALREAGLSPRAHAFPGELTTAERRGVVLARALAGGPRLLLVDEPTAGLGAPAADELLVRLREARARGTTLLVATQSAGLGPALDARVLLLEAGRVRPAATDGAT